MKPGVGREKASRPAPALLVCLALLALLPGPTALPASEKVPVMSLVLSTQPSLGAPGATLVDLSTRHEVRIRVLLLGPEKPLASLLLMVGGDGRLDLDEDTTINRERGNFLKRSAGLFAEQGFQVALMDVADDQSSFLGSLARNSPEHAQDIAGVMAYLRQRHPVPVWLVGASNGTISAANAAARLGKEDGPDGLVLSSSILRGRHFPDLFTLDLAEIHQPTLVVHHRQDGCHACPYEEVSSLLAALKNAAPKELISFSDGLPPVSEPCQALSYHGYYGIEPQVVETISSWIKSNNPPAFGRQ